MVIINFKGYMLDYVFGRRRIKIFVYSLDDYYLSLVYVYKIFSSFFGGFFLNMNGELRIILYLIKVFYMENRD